MKEHHFEVTIRLPVSTLELPDDLIVLDGNTTDSVSVKFIGRGFGVLRDQLTKSPQMVDLASPLPDQDQTYPQNRSVDLSEENVIFRGGSYTTLSVVSFVPGAVRFTLDRKISRLLPIRIASDDPIPQRYLWSVLSSSYVQVTGAASVINRLDSCYTVPVGCGYQVPDTEIENTGGIVNINPPSVTAELVRPAAVVFRLE